MTPRTTSMLPAPPTRKEMERVLAAVPPATLSAKDDDEPRDWPTILFRVFVVLLLLVGVGAAVLGAQGSSAEDERTRLLELIDTECGPGGAYVGQPLCVATAPQRAEETAQAATAEGVNAAQVIELVRAELDARGPATVSAAVVDAAVRRVLAENPGLYQGPQGVPGGPGPGPSQEQVDAAVAAVMAADPERFRGERGADGASPPCLSEPSECRGTDGEPPVSITQRYADGSSSVCTRDDGSPDSAPTYTCPPPSGGGSGGDDEPPTDPGPADPGPTDPGPTDPPGGDGGDDGGGLFGG